MRDTIQQFSKIGLALLVIAVALGATWGISGKLSKPDEDVYLDSPFAAVEADIPRLVAVRQYPDDKEEAKKYDEQIEKERKFFLEKGAYSRAAAEEREALDAAASGKYVNGRQLAERILQSNPQSVPAWNVLARALLYGENNLPLALNTARKARHLLERQGKTNADDADAREWYIRTLLLEENILRQLGRNAAGVRVIEVLEQLYGPLPQSKFWHLIKLKRYDEAEQALAAMEKDGRWPSNVLNDKLILASARRDRGAAFQAGREITARSDGKSAVMWSNFAGVALGDFRFDETDEALRKSIECGAPNFYGTAYIDLAELRLQEGKFAEMPQTVRLLNGHRATLGRAARAHIKANVDRMLALLLLSVGRHEEAERFARRSHEVPSRQGSNSVDPVSADLANGLVFWSTLQAQLQQRNETDFIVGSSLVSRTEALAKVQSESWRVKNEVQRILSDRTRVNPLRPYVLEEIKIESWMLGQFAQMLPQGVFREMLRHARETESHPAAVPYFDALEAEASLIAGDPKAALEWAMKALAALPSEREKLLRARTNAVAAEASRLLDGHADYLARMDQVLDDFPAVLGLLNIKIPVRIEDDADPLTGRVVDHMYHSPLFRDDAAGFVIRIARKDKQVEVTIARGDGKARWTVLAQAEAGKESNENSKTENDDAALELASIAQFRAKLLCPWMDLTTKQINALDIIRRAN